MPVTLTAPEVRSSWITPLASDNNARPLWLWRALPATVLIGACAAAALTEVSAEEGQVLCPYRLATGGWCPGCGCTRALKAMMHGDLRGSMILNPWMLLVLFQATIISGFFLFMPDKARTWWRENDFLVAKVNLAAAGLIWAARLTVGDIPLPFAS